MWHGHAGSRMRFMRNRGHRTHAQRHDQHGNERKQPDRKGAHGGPIKAKRLIRNDFAQLAADFQRRTPRSRSELPMTVTELSDMAAPAMIGESRMLNHGYRTPAAIGTPAALKTNAKNRF